MRTFKIIYSIRGIRKVNEFKASTNADAIRSLLKTLTCYDKMFLHIDSLKLL